MITLNDQQLDAVKKCVQWYFTDSVYKPYFTIFGLAGTGKSTVLSIIIKMLGLNNQDVIFCTLTGKAALVLRMKGNPANTVHKTFYSVFKTRTSFGFNLKKHIQPNIKLIVIDEVSMITEKMLQDILSFGIPTICLGDWFQLPCLGKLNFLIAEPEKYSDVFLSKPMRQDDSSGILQLASIVRNSQQLEYGTYNASKVVHFEEIGEKILDYDIVLCFSNAMRRKLNLYIRQLKGYTSIYPVKGERIMCLMNNYNYMIDYQDIPIYIINGMFGIVNEDSKIIEYNDLELIDLNFTPDFLTDKNSDNNLILNPKCFCQIFEQYQKNPNKEAFIEELYNENIDDDTLGDICMIDYGYAASVHKYQGSEADNVLLVVEDRIPSHIYFRWLYTGITRAKKSITVATMN